MGENYFMDFKDIYEIPKEILEKWDKEYFWHPFTQMKVYREEDNLIFVRGEGVYLYDINGKKYIDAISSLWCNVHGHNHPRLNNALIKQLCRVAHTTTLGSSNVPAIVLAKKLVEITPPCLTKVFYSEDGAEANEIALKMAYHYFYNKGEKNRKYFITLSNAYHGDTIGAVSVGGIEIFHNAYKPLLFKTFKLPSPYWFCKENFGALNEECREALLNQLEKILKQYHKETIGIILESGLQAAAGMLPYPKGFMKGVEKLAKKYGVLLIVDEVATGFGRTGTLFYIEQEEVCPDFMTLGKGITGGYLPLAVTLTTEEIFNAFLGEFGEAKHFYHGHTYTGNNLACAVALENLNIFKEENTLALLKPKIDYLREALKEFGNIPTVYDIRQLGFMVGIEIRKPNGEPFPYGERIGFKIAYKAREKGVFLRPLGDVMVLMMPLIIEYNEINQVLEALKWSIEEITSKYFR
jgi:adenosylmethionine-8-amino-7-oxononanoate aminotransferase